MPSSFVTAAGLDDNNTFTGTNTFTGAVTFSGTTVDTTASEIAPAASTSGAPTVPLTVTAAVDLAMTASTEAPSVYLNLSASRQFATGALTSQRALKIAAPTYRFVGASTITNAATFYIDAAPTAGTNATITNAYALWVDAGITRLDGGVVLGSTLTLGGSVTCGSNDLLGVGIAEVQVVRAVANLSLRPAVAGGSVEITKADGTTKAIESNATGLGFYGVAPVARQVLATGGGATADNIITALQALGLLAQS
jgi:hypothetical protein